jgi:hypothetical protein
MHVLPRGFHRIRHYGLLADGNRAANIARARELLSVPSRSKQPATSQAITVEEPAVLSRPCPCCGGRLVCLSLDCSPDEAIRTFYARLRRAMAKSGSGGAALLMPFPHSASLHAGYGALLGGAADLEVGHVDEVVDRLAGPAVDRAVEHCSNRTIYNTVANRREILSARVMQSHGNDREKPNRRDCHAGCYGNSWCGPCRYRDHGIERITTWCNAPLCCPAPAIAGPRGCLRGDVSRPARPRY